jgi:hypothetical protein
LPVLSLRASGRTADARSRDPTLPRRRIHVGKPGSELPSLQQPQGQSHSPGSRHDAQPVWHKYLFC